MKAAIFREPYHFEVVDVPVPEEKGKEILIKVEYCAICGSDLHTYKTGAGVQPGQIMGHEFGGVVSALGSDYEGPLKVGDRVVTNPTTACGECLMCRKGLPNICVGALTNSLAYGRPGAFAEYVLQAEGAEIYKLPEHVSTRHASMIEPLAVAVHAVNRAKVRLNDTAVVFGAGTIGLLVTQVLKAIGCVRVIQVDVSKPRLEIAAKVGADHTINAGEAEDVVAEIAKITGPGYYGKVSGLADIAFECAAVPDTVKQAVKAVRHGGQVINVAIASKSIPVNVTAVVQKEIDFKGAYGYIDEFKEAIDLVTAGKIDLESLISYETELENITEGFERQMDASNSVKVLIKCS